MLSIGILNKKRHGHNYLSHAESSVSCRERGNSFTDTLESQFIIINAENQKILHHNKKIYQMKQIKLSQLQQNKGQIPGLPSNPRRFTDAEIERLAQSIEETPELLKARSLIVVKHEKFQSTPLHEGRHSFLQKPL